MVSTKKYIKALDQLLNHYPRFLDRRPTSNHYKHKYVLAEQIKELKRNVRILRTTRDIDRPFKIWKEQITPYIYNIRYEVNFPDIKRVKLYRGVNENLLTLNQSNAEGGQITGMVGTGGTLTNTTTEHHSGNNSFQLLCNGGIGSIATSNISGINEGDTITFKTYIKTVSESATNFITTISVYDEALNLIESYPLSTPLIKRPLTWTEISQTLEVPEDTYYVKPSISAEDFTAGDLLYWDDAELRIITEPELLKDSGVLPKETSTYTSYWKGTCENVVPTSKFYIEVENYYEEIFKKGFPHNEVKRGDIYDPDPILDIFGINLNIPRRKLLVVNNADLINTTPPYCRDVTEWDYTYENRIKEHMDELLELPLPVLEFKKWFHITPLLEGRWRYLTRMDVHLMDEKFMLADEWNPCVFNLLLSLKTIPKNINIYNGFNIQTILDKTFPIGKKAYFIFSTEEIFQKQKIRIVDKLKDKITGSVELGSHNLQIHDHGVGIKGSLKHYTSKMNITGKAIGRINPGGVTLKGKRVFYKDGVFIDEEGNRVINYSNHAHNISGEMVRPLRIDLI